MVYSEDIEIFYFLFAGTLGMFLLSAGIIVFMVLYQRRLYQHELKLQEVETTYQKQLVQSNMEEIENERIRISKDLHDEIGGLFSALSIKLDQLEEAGQSGDEDMGQIIRESKYTIDMGIKSVRRISHNMIPPSLEMFGLVAALEDLCAQFEGGPSGLPIELFATEDMAEPDKKKSLVIFRIVQELIQNTLRHSNATGVEISLRSEPQNLVLVYKDNGKGFDYAERENRKGMGLLNVESRIHQLQASFDFYTAPGKGVEVIIHIPNQQLYNQQ